MFGALGGPRGERAMVLPGQRPAAVFGHEPAVTAFLTIGHRFMNRAANASVSAGGTVVMWVASG